MAAFLKSYPSPWSGSLILACKKCQLKIKAHKGPRSLAKLKRAIKENEHLQERIHVLNVPCMKVCPKDGVAVYDPHRSEGQLYILRSAAEIPSLIEAVTHREAFAR